MKNHSFSVFQSFSRINKYLFYQIAFLKNHIALGAIISFGCLPAKAVIVAGTSGTGNNNDTEAGLISYLSGASADAYPYWNNLVRVGNASGTYLGYNASTQRGWVLAANHVGAPSNITVAGESYTAVGTRVGNSDLKLYEIGGGPSDPALPSLPTVPLASITPTLGESVLMFGRGFTTSTSSPYAWGTPGGNEANSTRWGTNTIEQTSLVNLGTTVNPNIQPYLVTDFDAIGDPGVTEFDAQGATGDSGGGLFVLRGGEWQIAGVAHFVDDGPDFLELSPTGDNIVDPSQPGDFTAYSDVASKLVQINAITGTLVPEPSTLLLSISSLSLLLRRRR